MMNVSKGSYSLFWELTRAGIDVVPQFQKAPLHIHLLNEDDKTSLYLHHECEEERRPCYIYLDLELGSVCMVPDRRTFLQEPEEPVTMRRTLKWEVPLMTTHHGNVMMVELSQMFQIVLDESKIERLIGRVNSVAIFNSKAEKAILKIGEVISKSDGDVEEVTIDKDSFILCDVEGKTSDLMLEELAKTLNMRWWENSNAILWGTLRALKEKRKESWCKLSWRRKEFTEDEILMFRCHLEWDDTDDKNLDRLYRIAAETAVKEFVDDGVWHNFLHWDNFLPDDFGDIYANFLNRTVVTNKEVLEQCRRILWDRWMDVEVVVKIVKDVADRDTEELRKIIYELHADGEEQACEDFLFLLKRRKIYLNRKRAKGVILLEKQLEEKRKGIGLPKIDISIRDIEGSYKSETLLLQI